MPTALPKNSNKEEFLEHRNKKRWVDDKSRHHYSYMIYPRALFITWGNREYWDWKCFKETSEENIEVAKLSHLCWLDIRGKFKMSDLSPGVEYEIAYELKLSKAAFGWELPVQVRLSLPDGKSRERIVSLLERPRGEWFQLKVGSFKANHDQENGEVCFDLMEHGGHWKHGLVIKGATIRPLIKSFIFQFSN